MTNYSLRKFDDESAAGGALRKEKNMPLKKNMTQKYLFKDTIPEAKVDSQETPK